MLSCVLDNFNSSLKDIKQSLVGSRWLKLVALKGDKTEWKAGDIKVYLAKKIGPCLAPLSSFPVLTDISHSLSLLVALSLQYPSSLLQSWFEAPALGEFSVGLLPPILLPCLCDKPRGDQLQPLVLSRMAGHKTHFQETGKKFCGQMSSGKAELTNIKQVYFLQDFSEPFIFILKLQEELMVHLQHFPNLMDSKNCFFVNHLLGLLLQRIHFEKCCLVTCYLMYW